MSIVDWHLPSGIGEQYGWTNIVSMSDPNDKIANADGYSILAFGTYRHGLSLESSTDEDRSTVLWLKTSPYAGLGVFGRRWSDSVVGNMLKSPNDGHPLPPGSLQA